MNFFEPFKITRALKDHSFTDDKQLNNFYHFNVMVNAMALVTSFGEKVNNLSVGKKLTSGFIIVLCIMLLIAGAGIYGFRQVDENARKETLTVSIVTALNEARINRTIFQLTGEEKYAELNASALRQVGEQLASLSQFNMDTEGRARFAAMQTNLQTYLGVRDKYIQTLRQRNTLAADLHEQWPSQFIEQASAYSEQADASPQAAMLAARLAAKAQQIRSAVDALITRGDRETLNKLNELLGSIDTTAAQLGASTRDTPLPWLSALTDQTRMLHSSAALFVSASGDQQTQSTALSNAATALNETVADFHEFRKMRMANSISHVETLMLAGTLAGVLFGLIVAAFITRNITRPLRETLAVANRIAQGDLTVTVSSLRRDEPGLLMQAVGTMNDSLKSIITRVRHGVDNVSRASSEIAAGNIDLSSRTEEQSAAVVQTAASMEELTSTVKETAGNAQQASQLAAQASTNADRGGKVVNEVVETMRNIQASSGKIADIISVINGIAFQTNILALNAAVEAARAGEQGRGFAVVAGEVRTLASRSATAAKEIGALITEANQRVENGAQLVASAGEAMEDIVGSVAKVREIMDEIARACTEQSRGIAQIGQAMSEMDTTTQQNAALVEESSAAASSLEEQARELEQMVAIFNVGTSAPRRAEPAAVPVAAPAPKALAVAGAQGEWEHF
ncbi:HAMP domain-containing protein [Cronobacter sakazakii]|nr:HAMP domain-containing protein [Cronobacter sakazakii]ELQ6208035.1 HAMP domain-containing protein [Cronobacter sakazakii]ELY6373193.1 HAMP domain-containing protein [Cronobacter sakazakii]ELZ3956934.1 HAMP domain-containing protein [Cronobacter sakazakii]